MLRKAFVLALMACALGAAPALAQETYVEPASLWGVEVNGNTLLAVESAELAALKAMGGKEPGVFGFVFKRPMPGTTPFYRLAKLVDGRPSPTLKLYTTSREEHDRAVGERGYVSEGVLCHTVTGFLSDKPLVRMSRAGSIIYVSDPAASRRMREVYGYKDEGPVASLLNHAFGWRADYWIFNHSFPAGTKPESYKLVCRRGDGAFFARDGLAFKFKKAATRFNGDLGEGECAWLDRKMGDAEPGLLLAPLDNIFEPKRVHDDELYWTFSVYNDGRGRMIVTGAEAGRPEVPPGNRVEIKRDVNAPQLEGPRVPPPTQRVRPAVPRP